MALFRVDLDYETYHKLLVVSAWEQNEPDRQVEWLLRQAVHDAFEKIDALAHGLPPGPKEVSGMEVTSRGQIAYEAYMTCHGPGLVSWSSLLLGSQQAWQAAAQAVLRDTHGARLSASAAWLDLHRAEG